MKLTHVLGLMVAVLGSVNAFAAKTDNEVIDLTVQQIQAAIIASTSAGEDCSIDFDEAKFAASLKNDTTNVVLNAYAGSGSPEGNGDSRELLTGAIVVTAGEAYMTREEFSKFHKAPSAYKMVLGLNSTIMRNSCKSDALKASLEVYRDKDSNVVSVSNFKIK